jgi:hypothetical protein
MILEKLVAVSLLNVSVGIAILWSFHTVHLTVIVIIF